MPRPKSDQPTYRYHVSGQAVVTFCGQNFYLGEYDSPASKAKYYALLSEYNAGGKTRAPAAETHQADQPVTVQCVTAEFREHIKTRYANNPQETNRFENLCTTLEDEYGDVPVDQFGPRKLAEIRDLFVVSGNCRRYVNQQTRNVRDAKVRRKGVRYTLFVPVVPPTPRPTPEQPGTLGHQLTCIDVAIERAEDFGTTAAKKWQAARREVIAHAKWRAL